MTLGDFGFNIRRTQIPVANGKMKVAIFAEPTKLRCGPPRPSEIRTTLLPGDQLIMVNGCIVDNLGRDELIALIQVLISNLVIFIYLLEFKKILYMVII